MAWFPVSIKRVIRNAIGRLDGDDSMPVRLEGAG